MSVLQVCRERHYVLSEVFMLKMLQLYQVSRINHGVMLVGPPGSGKSSAWRILLEALQRVEKREAQVRIHRGFQFVVCVFCIHGA